MYRILLDLAPLTVVSIFAGVFAATLATGAARAEQLTIDRIFADPNIDGPRLRELEFSPDGKRVTFLRGRDDDSNHTDLWEFHIGDGETRLLVNSDDIIDGEEVLSHAEILRRTTQRISDQRGIVAYEWSEDGKALLFPLNGDLHYFAIGGNAGARRLTETKADEFDVQLSPDGTYASFIRGQDLYIIDIKTGEETRLTFDGEGSVKNGVAEFVAQEEMDRHTGYWWSGDETAIAFAQIDESPVAARARYEINATSARMIEHERYPSAGTANVLIRIGVVRIASGEITWMDIGTETDIYIPRVDWLPDSKTLAIQRQSRDQKTLDLLFADAATGKSRQIIRETSPTWINLHDDLRFLEDSPFFIWSSERSGFKHFYLYDLDGNPVRQITGGDWVANQLLGVDEDQGLIYFEANAASSLERHLYKASLTRDGDNAVRITAREGWHEIEVDDTARFYIDRFSDTDTPPQTNLHRIDGGFIATLEANELNQDHPYFPFLDRKPQIEFGVLPAEGGETLNYRLIKPWNFDPGRKYPVLVFVYGGPHAQLVTKTWPGRRALWLEVFANLGYLVFTVDNRGSFNRGKAFEDPIYRRMGKIEVEDQVRGVAYLKTLGYADTSRVGVFGWSYGGFMALMSMMTAPDVFHVGVAVAPVVDWRLYDTHYTERYLGDPGKDNAQGYEASSPISHVGGLRGPLLLIHGLADNNVLPQNSTALAQALQDRDIPFEMMFYPSKRHGIRGNETRRHLFKQVIRFLERNLKHVAP